jgi:hypothetical protein
VFEPHLKGYVELEEKQLTESVEALLAAETWSGDESTMASPGAPKVLGSASQVFLNIKKVLKRCSALTRGATLFALSQARCCCCDACSMRLPYAACLRCLHPSRPLGPASAPQRQLLSGSGQEPRKHLTQCAAAAAAAAAAASPLLLRLLPDN